MFSPSAYLNPIFIVLDVHYVQCMVRHSKQRALSDREFEMLLEGAHKLDDYYGIQAEFLIHVMGRLGLRRGEVTHMDSSWIDWRKEMVIVPYHKECETGLDNSVCGYCKQLAKQEAEYNEDVTINEAIDDRWTAKTRAAARDVYWGFDARVKLMLERFFDRFDKWEWSSSSINRRIKKAAEKANGLTRDDVHPHGLRATAATHHAARGLEMHSLMQYFGWAQPSTAEVYLSRNGENTARQLDHIH